eukprot:903952_1
MDLEDAEQIENVNNMSSDIDIAFTFDIMHRIKPAKNSRGRQRQRGNNNNNSTDTSGTNTNSVSGSPTRNSNNNNNKKTKKKIYFSGELDDQFLKDMKLISSLSCTNMVLFDINNKIRKYKSVIEILEEFYTGRLKAYSLRKKQMLKALEHLLMKKK